MAGQNQELNFNEKGLKDFQSFLEESLIDMQMQLKRLTEADEKLSASLAGDSKAAYEERTKAIQDDLKKKLEEFSIIINNVQYTNTASQKTDAEILFKIAEDHVLPF